MVRLEERYEIKVSELSKVTCKTEYEEKLKQSIVVEMLKNGDISIINWLLRIFNECMESGVVPEDWKAAYTVSICKEKLTEENVQIIEE